MDKTETNELLEECMLYFKARPVYKKLFLKMRDKYAGLGRFGGTVLLTSLSREEKSQLGGFFQRDYTSNKTITISADLMKRCLTSSKFAGLTWESILETYFGEPLQVKREIELAESKRREDYFTGIMEQISDESGREWLQRVLEEKKEGYMLITQLYKEKPEELRDILTYVTAGIAKLKVFQEKKQKELLPVFSANITGDPHYFDEGKAGEKLLFNYLRERNFDLKQEGLSRVEYKNRIYYEAGILKDEVSNDALAYGIHGWKTEGSLHEGIEGFLENREPVKLTLQTIGRLEKVCGQSRQVYVVENPAVFSVLIREHPERSVICGNGQLRLAVLILMDKFSCDTVFWYAGDFDPEGLLIAQKLKLRYGERLKLWKYQVDLYETYLSEVELSDRRMKKLEQVSIKELQEIKETMYKKQRAAYQESMMEVLTKERSSKEDYVSGRESLT